MLNHSPGSIQARWETLSVKQGSCLWWLVRDKETAPHAPNLSIYVTAAFLSANVTRRVMQHSGTPTTRGHSAAPASLDFQFSGNGSSEASKNSALATRPKKGSLTNLRQFVTATVTRKKNLGRNLNQITLQNLILT